MDTLVIRYEESIRRLSQRRVCTQCGATYHLDFKKPVQDGVCDVCGSALTQRDDDKSESIRKRLQIYHTETKPLLDRYEKRGILYRVDGVGTIDDVWKRVLAIFEE
jgi:adenylate kinase